MLNVRPFTSANSRAVSVVFPAPDGDEMMSRSGFSLDILDLLPDLLELRLDVHHEVRKLHILALRAQGIGFARHFLEQKLQTTPDGCAIGEQRLELIEMAGQAYQLLGDVTAICH